MKVGIIGYGSMGKMLVEKILESKEAELYVSNRTKEKINSLADRCNICENKQLASLVDIVFLCVRPIDMKQVLLDIRDSIKKETLLVSLNGSITFEQLEIICNQKIAKVIPSVTAEINQSQTLVCYNKSICKDDKINLTKLLTCMGTVIELPENEMGMGSELVSCMPGFIAAIFREICTAAKKHTSFSEKEIMQLVLNTMIGTGELMLANDYSFDEVVSRVATKGGITEEGTKVIEENFSEIAEKIFVKTLEKRRLTAEKAQRIFEE